MDSEGLVGLTNEEISEDLEDDVEVEEKKAGRARRATVKSGEDAKKSQKRKKNEDDDSNTGGVDPKKVRQTRATKKKENPVFSLQPPPPPPPHVTTSQAAVGLGGISSEDSEDFSEEEMDSPYEERPGEFLVKSIISELLIEYKQSGATKSEEDETLFLHSEILKRLRQDLDLEFVYMEKKKVEMSGLMLHGITQMEITHGGPGVKSNTALFKLGDLILKGLEDTVSNGHIAPPPAPLGQELEM